MARPRHELALWHTSYTSNGIAISSNQRPAADGLGNVVWSPHTASSLDWFNVKDYSAVGDNTNDDTAEIQAALNACDAAGGGTVYFPAGTYKITAVLSYDGVNLHVLGEGNQYGPSIIRQATNNTGVFTFPTAITTAQASTQAPLLENIRLAEPFDVLLVCGKVAQEAYERCGYNPVKADVVFLIPHPAARNWTRERLAGLAAAVQDTAPRYRLVHL